VERLRHSDYLALLEVARESAAITDIDEFASRVLELVRRLVPADIVAYNEVDVQHDRLVMGFAPLDAMIAGGHEAFRQYMHQHPLIRYYSATTDRGAMKISDLVRLRDFKRLDLYQQFFRELDITRQLVVTLPAEPPVLIGIAFNRHARDFTERDRTLLNLLRPHLMQAHDNAAVWTRMTRLARTTETALEVEHHAAILLDQSDRIQYATTFARRLLDGYFKPAHVSDTLPDELIKWLRERRRTPFAAGSLTIHRPAGVVTARIVSGLAGVDGTLLLLKEQPRCSRPTLMSLGLTAREAEVMALIADGSTNAAIADTLVISPRTAEKHVEHILAKLAVATRREALERVRDVQGTRRA
jgi:DNA-binding CsgD family transcriptional regulator